MITWITDKRASIFDSKCSVLVNPVNCDGIMGAGLALEFKRRHPSMFAEYKHLCFHGRLIPGKLFYWSYVGTPFESLRASILCFPTKWSWRNSSHLSYIRDGLAEFVRIHHSLGIDSIAFPMLGCGLGGLDRGEVGHLMREYLEKLENLSVEIYLR